MNYFHGELHAKFLALVVTCALISDATAGGGRRLASMGDILGTLHKPTTPEPSGDDSRIIRTREVTDHAHYYNAVEALTRWAESTFALTAYAHKQLALYPNGGNHAACVYDGVQCLFNPTVVADASFPAPELFAERVLKRFAMEAAKCRQAVDRPSCHLDSNCDWDDVTDACFLAHDPHQDFVSAIKPCRDMLYTSSAVACWRREPEFDSTSPCGGAACRLYKAGSGGDAGGAGSGLPEDRCMPYLGVAAKLAPIDVYSLLKRYFGSVKMPAWKLTPEDLTSAPLAGRQEQGEEAAGPPLIAGYGDCPAAALHHAMQMTCRDVEEEACLADGRCSWRIVANGRHCVLRPDTVIGILMGSRPFSREVLKTEASCRAATSADACRSVAWVL